MSPARADLLVEIGSKLHVTSFTPRSDAYMMKFWRDLKIPGEAHEYDVPSLWLDPLLICATAESLRVVVCKGGDAPRE